MPRVLYSRTVYRAVGNVYRGARRQPVGLPSLCRPTVRLLRSKPRLAARQTLCTPAKLTVDKRVDTRCAHRTWRTWFLQYGCCQWLQTMTGLVVHVGMALVAMDTAARGRRCSVFMHIWTLACPRVVPCHRWCIGSKLSIFETHRHCDALVELILTHCAVSRASLSFTIKCGPKSAGFLSR